MKSRGAHAIRIIAGSARGRRLDVPAAEGHRPTSSRVREALFSMLADRPEGAGVLDLFAGCGALGLEALSRGAAACVLVESSPDVLPTLRENVAALGLPGASVVAVDALEPHCYGAWAPYDLLLLDPPYRKGLGELALNAVAAGGLLASGGMAAMVHEAGGAPRAPAGWSVTRTRRHGDSAITLLEVPEGDE